MEVWKDIEGYEGLYQISNVGNVKSLARAKKDTLGRIQSIKEKILKAAADKDGYFRVVLQKNGEKKNKIAHRLVAQAFIPNPDNKPQINHIDGNKQNNRLSNLEWCTLAENRIHAFNTGLQFVHKGEKNHLSKSVKQLDKDTNKLIRMFGSTREAERETGINHSHISKVCKKEYNTAGGFKWEYNLKDT